MGTPLEPPRPGRQRPAAKFRFWIRRTAISAAVVVVGAGSGLVAANGPAAAALAAGPATAVALDATPGGVLGWGYNYFGQLGDGTLIDRQLAAGRTAGLTSGVRQVAAGFDNGAALMTDGTVRTWGYNVHGALGNLNVRVNDFSSTPLPVPGLTGISQIAVGEDFMLALAADGRVWAWGDNALGIVGDPASTPADVAFPILRAGLANISQISAGDRHAVALRTDGSVLTWGSNKFGQSGNPANTTDIQAAPFPVAGVAGTVTVVAGTDSSSFAILGNGNVLAWGYNHRGQLGSAVSIGLDRHPVPTPVAGVSNVVQLAVADSVLALRTDGTVWAWGDNDNNFIGSALPASLTTPVPIPALTNVRQVALGAMEVFDFVYPTGFALGVDGTVKVWGDNNVGGYGDGTTTTRQGLFPVPGLNHVTQIATAAVDGNQRPYSGSAILAVTTDPSHPRVPNVIGSTCPAAVAALNGTGFTLASCPGGNIFEQSPRGGMSLLVAGTVTVTTSTITPMVIGLSCSAAIAAVNAAGLVTSCPGGIVTGQTQPAGTSVVYGSTVSLVVQARVPALVGVDQSTAYSRLAAASLNARPSYTNNCLDTGSVRSQSPAAGTMVALGTAVDINIATCTGGGTEK